MSDLNELHDQAMEIADDADIAKRKGNIHEARSLYQKAYELEKQVAHLVDVEPSRSVMYRSAAALALECNLLDDARIMILTGLSGETPPEIVRELNELLAEVDARRGESTMVVRQIDTQEARAGARVIAVTSGKVGVGKTTTTANLGVALARINQKVILIDADIGLRNLDIIMGLENRIVYDLVDIIEGRCKPRQAMIRHKMFPQLYLIPAAQARDKTAVSPADMMRLADYLREEFDFVLIDSPAGIERGFRNAVAPADEILIVTNLEVSAVRDTDRVIGLLETENKPPGQLILNRLNPEMVRRGEMLSPDDVTDLLAIRLIGIVPEDETVVSSSNSGIPVTLNEKSGAGMAYRDIARRLMGERVPFMTSGEPSGFFRRLTRLFIGRSGTS